MPIPVSQPGSTHVVEVSPYWDAPQQTFANDTTRKWHEESLRRMGEYTVWVLKWRIEDYEDGLVGLCPSCGVQDEDYYRVYGQPNDADCEDCLGTTFEGGYRAIIVRPTVWDYGEERHQESNHGEVVSLTAQVQTPSDFRARVGDWAMQHDNRRWQVQDIRDTKVHTGFIGTKREVHTMGYGYTMQLEDPSNLIYRNLFSSLELSALDVNNHFPTDFSDFEFAPANGYLLINTDEAELDGGFSGTDYFGSDLDGGAP